MPKGTEIGLALTPLYPSVPLAASADPQLYELLGLVDALRVGRVRERQLAAIALQERLEGGNEGVAGLGYDLPTAARRRTSFE